jgi:hypothetical protein
MEAWTGTSRCGIDRRAFDGLSVFDLAAVSAAYFISALTDLIAPELHHVPPDATL